MEIKGKFSKEVLINLPYKYVVAHYAEQIKNVRLVGTSQSKLKLKHTDGFQALIEDTSLVPIRIKYEVHKKQKPYIKELFMETLIEKDLVQATGHGLLAIPADLTADKKVTVHIHWRNLPKNWQSITNYGIETNIQFIGNRQEIAESSLIAGNLRIYKVIDSKNPVYLSLYGSFDFTDKEIIEDISTIISSQRGFFKDNDFPPFYLIGIMEGYKEGSYGGTRLHNAFLAFIPKKEKRIRHFLLLAHEHLHNWFGGKIDNPDEGQRSRYWWNEGFTEYFCRILAFRSGGLNFEEFVDEVNTLLSNYFLSPVINEPNSKVEKDFWTDLDVEKLPYYRGFTFAIYCNYLIQKYNKDASLDNLLLDVFGEAQKSGKPFSHKLFSKTILQYIPKKEERKLWKYILDGTTIEFEDLSKSLPLEKVNMGRYYLESIWK